MLYSKFLQPLLFRLDPEEIHELTISLARNTPHVFLPLISRLFTPKTDPRLETTIFGRVLPHPIGLAAGFDRHGRLVPIMKALGFSWIELGSLLLRAQTGNPKPRLFRYKDREAVINRMGFPALGLGPFVARLKALRQEDRPGLLGVNIGKNTDVPVEQAAADYLACINEISPFVDYVALNVSCPNSAGHQKLQDESVLRDFLAQTTARVKSNIPLVLKISPDLDTAHLDQVIRLITEFKLAGVIATNTTLKRPTFESDPGQFGGLSGKPLFPMAIEKVRILRSSLPKEVAVIGVGGISTGEDVRMMMEVGASAVQLYTSLVYRGPSVVRLICDEIFT